jgi:hypothetical protein
MLWLSLLVPPLIVALFWLISYYTYQSERREDA